MCPSSNRKLIWAFFFFFLFVFSFPLVRLEPCNKVTVKQSEVADFILVLKARQHLCSLILQAHFGAQPPSCSVFQLVFICFIKHFTFLYLRVFIHRALKAWSLPFDFSLAATSSFFRTHLYIYLGNVFLYSKDKHFSLSHLTYFPFQSYEVS